MSIRNLKREMGGRSVISYQRKRDAWVKSVTANLNKISEVVAYFKAQG